MSELITLDANNEHGKILYKNNSQFQRLSNLMEHPEYRAFFRDYMNDWQTAKTMIMFMKLYEAIENRCEKDLSPYEKISILDNIINNSELRQKVCSEFIDWTK